MLLDQGALGQVRPPPPAKWPIKCSCSCDGESFSVARRQIGAVTTPDPSPAPRPRLPRLALCDMINYNNYNIVID